jgi:hypothetical protein
MRQQPNMLRVLLAYTKGVFLATIITFQEMPIWRTNQDVNGRGLFRFSTDKTYLTMLNCSTIAAVDWQKLGIFR